MAATEEEELAEPLMDFSNIGRTVDGAGFAYRSLSCVGKRIGGIKAIQAYSHLHHVDLSKNKIKDVTPLKALQFVLQLNLAENLVPNLKAWESEEAPAFPHLVHLDLTGNALTALPPLPFRSLRTASFARNEIATCQAFGGHEKLETLDLSQNAITSLAGITALPAMTRLDVSANQLVDINGLAEVPVLADLSLAKNKLEALEGPWQDLAALESLNLSGCLLAVPKPLEVLRQLPKLRNLEVAENPFVETLEGAVRVEVLVCHWRLANIDGEPVTEEELEQAKELNVTRLAEEQARLKAAAGAADGDPVDD